MTGVRPGPSLFLVVSAMWSRAAAWSRWASARWPMTVAMSPSQFSSVRAAVRRAERRAISAVISVAFMLRS